MEIIFACRDEAANVFGSLEFNWIGRVIMTIIRSAPGSTRKEQMVRLRVMFSFMWMTCELQDHQKESVGEHRNERLASLGMQDAAGKWRLPCLDAGAWRGAVVNTSGGEVAVLATRVKRLKLKSILAWLAEALDNAEGIDHKLLEQKRGFLVHMVQTYPSLNPCLKGVHGTLDSWRCNRDVWLS
jgi:hypothetical protein